MNDTGHTPSVEVITLSSKGPSSLEWNVTLLASLNIIMFSRLAPAVTLLIIVMVVGVIGNVIICYIFIRKLSKSGQNFLLLFLGLFDLLSSCVGIPSEIYDMRHYYLYESAKVCKTMRFLTTFPSLASILVLLVIAVDRYRKICKPLKHQIHLFHTRIIIIIIVVIALAFSVPALYIYGHRTFETPTKGLYGHDCSVDDVYKDRSYPLIYEGIFCAAFALFTVVLVTIYFLIWLETRRHIKYMKTHATFGTSVADENMTTSSMNYDSSLDNMADDSCQSQLNSSFSSKRFSQKFKRKKQSKSRSRIFRGSRGSTRSDVNPKATPSNTSDSKIILNWEIGDGMDSGINETSTDALSMSDIPKNNSFLKFSKRRSRTTGTNFTDFDGSLSRKPKISNSHEIEKFSNESSGTEKYTRPLKEDLYRIKTESANSNQNDSSLGTGNLYQAPNTGDDISQNNDDKFSGTGLELGLEPKKMHASQVKNRENHSLEFAVRHVTLLTAPISLGPVQEDCDTSDQQGEEIPGTSHCQAEEIRGCQEDNSDCQEEELCGNSEYQKKEEGGCKGEKLCGDGVCQGEELYVNRDFQGGELVSSPKVTSQPVRRSSMSKIVSFYRDEDSGDSPGSHSDNNEPQNLSYLLHEMRDKKGEGKVNSDNLLDTNVFQFCDDTHDQQSSRLLDINNVSSPDSCQEDGDTYTPNESNLISSNSFLGQLDDGFKSTQGILSPKLLLSSHDNAATNQQHAFLKHSKSNQSLTAKKAKKALKATRTTIIAFVITTGFIVSYLPHLILVILRSVKTDFEHDLDDALLNLYNVFLRSYFANNVLNVFVYGSMNLEFRTQVVGIWAKIKSPCSDR